MVVVILMVDNIGAVLVGPATYKVTIEKSSEPVYTLMLSVGLFLYYGGFSLAHYLLSVKYSRMASNVPVILEGKPEP
jgi:hypothetical protein